MYAQSSAGPSSVLGGIEALESRCDPKCHATANRLEDFMFGTPLSSEARFRKNILMKDWVRHVWQHASLLAKKQGESKLALNRLQQSFKELGCPEVAEPQSKKPIEGEVGVSDWLVSYSGQKLNISRRDKRQYASVAYALRAILAVKQEELTSAKQTCLSMEREALQELKLRLDLYTLACLKLADQQAREANEETVSQRNLEAQWQKLGLAAKVSKLGPPQKRNYLLPDIVHGKIKAYSAYNDVSNQLFVRNLQVYFARARWPKDPGEGGRLKEYFTNAMVQFTIDLYLHAQGLAQQRGGYLLQERDVHRALQDFTPYVVNEFEDVTFFPKLKSKQIVLEAYDLDSFRDSGLHWRYIQYAIRESKGRMKLDTDPFAAEILAEGVAQFGVLVLRIAGQQAKEAGQDRLSSKHIDLALREVQSRIENHVKAPEVRLQEPALASSPETTVIEADRYFDEVTSQSGIVMEHRSSNWLSRQLRSYLSKGEGVGEITIPPAFGGSGIAAEDLNNDGWCDLLVLSGAGNRYYSNKGDGSFEDVTVKAGLDWKRPDGYPGEPRQPVIVDFDNDGWQDILITYANDAHRIYRNQGDGTFEDVTAGAGLGGDGLVGGPATVLDFDKDGLLDVYIGYFGNYLKGTLPTLARRNRNGSPNKLFRNIGGFKFEDVTEQSGTGDVGWAQAVGHSDFDGDGWQDLIVGNDFGVNVYYRNKGDGTFEDVADQLGTGKPSYTMGIGIADLNQDLHPDYYISNIVTMNKDQKYTLPTAETQASFNPDKLAQMRVVEANDLFLSKKSEVAGGRLSYALSTMVDRGYSSTGWSWDADFFDFDHDGDEDLYVLNGMNDFNVYSSDNPYYAEPHGGESMPVSFAHGRSEKNVFFVNRGGRLVESTHNSGLGLVGNSRSAVYFDYDNDGDLDVAINHYHGQVQLFENRVGTQSGNWAKLRLIGKGNRDAIGAKVVFTLDDGRTIWRECHSTIGYLSVHPKELHVGLGKTDKARGRVIWSDGDTSAFEVNAGQRLLIRQAK